MDDAVAYTNEGSVNIQWVVWSKDTQNKSS